MDKTKIRTFVKTYLTLKGKTTSRELAEVYTKIGFERYGISSKQMASFLQSERKNQHSGTILSDIRCETKKGKKLWYIQQ